MILVRCALLRDTRGVYRGMMETMQGITGIVGLPGAKPTQDWD